MHLIVCIDERDGLSFCGRRLSRDGVLNRHMVELASGQKLWMNGYSAKMFAGDTVCVHEDFLSKACPGEFCFLENSPLPETNEALESVILYHWNRAYPSNVRFPRALLEGMHLNRTEEFPGRSHEMITMEWYTR